MWLIVALVCSIVFGSNSAMDPEQVEKEKLAFIERTIVEIYVQADLPQVFNTKNTRLAQCGCEWNAGKITWGSGVGTFCKVTTPPQIEHCGENCLSPRGESILLLCPQGWHHDCQNGCSPPEFGTVFERTQFLEQSVDLVVKYGYDYVQISQDYLNECGCSEDGLKVIRYGSGIGFDCASVVDPTEECNGYRSCTNEAEEPVTIFCPAGHTPTCSGCQKALEVSASLDDRYDWMIGVLTGYIREAKRLLKLIPHYERVMACGCVGEVEEVGYGSLIGHFCHLSSVDDVQESCGPNTVCEDSSGDLILHLCPGGFVPSCEEGCGYTWKSEL